MKMISIFKRSVYLLYYIKESDYKQLRTFLNYSSALTGKSKTRLIIDIVLAVYKFNISFKDYFCFRFFELSDQERSEWAGSGFMYEYQLIMNPKNARVILEDKVSFLDHFRKFVKRDFSSLNGLRKDPGKISDLLENKTGLLVLKNSHGQVGAEVEVINCSDFNADSLLKYMVRKKYDLAEEYVIQHPDLMRLSPSGLNTVRIFTQYCDGKVEILGARLRITINSRVDNMAAGNPASPIDIDSGLVAGPGVFSDITREDITEHPVTKVKITGFRVPYWTELISLVREAALLTPENRSVGWDIAVTIDGPELIEGNHNWCRLLWQLPVRKGLRSEIDKYLKWKRY